MICKKAWLQAGSKIAVFAFMFVFQGARGQAFNCDFHGMGKYYGANVSSGDVVTAYDPQGVLIGTAYYVGGGEYATHAEGDDPTTPGVDEGAVSGDAITFKINGVLAVTSGDDIWQPLGSKTCNIEVQEQDPVSNPHGPYSGTEGTAVSFSSAGSIGTTYAWTFGDGGTSSSQNPTHTYGDNGTYTVTLTVTNSRGSDSENTTAAISNVVPTVSASSDAPKNEGSSVAFTGSHTDPGTSDGPFTYTWNFGDGGTGSGASASHTYVQDGTYTATLSVKDKDNGTGTKQVSVTINNVVPTVNAGSDKSGNEGSSISFSGSATDPGTSDVLAYSWNFGDGGTATGQNVSHTYGDNGTHTVTLTVNDGKGSGTDQAVATISNVNPTANIHGPYQGVVNLPISFNGSATDPGSADVLTYAWDLDNDGQYDDATGSNTQKTFTSVGTYTIGLKVTDDDGGSDTKSTTVDVNVGVPITVQTSPQNWQVKFDGTMYSSPQTFYCATGSSHEIEAPYVQGEINGQRYAWVNWNDGGAKAHTITVSGQQTITANYKLQYYVNIEDGGMASSHATGEGYYDPATYATINIDSQVVDQAGTSRYRFEGWQGSGNASYSGTHIKPTFQVNGPITETAVWGAKQYRLLVQSAFGNPQGTGWYNGGTSVQVSVDTAQSGGTGTRSGFIRWVGQGTGSYTGTTNPVTVVMNAPIVETAEWSTQYYLDIVSSYGSPRGVGWYNAGARAAVSVDTVAAVNADNRWRFVQWTGTGTGAYTGANPSFNLTMNAPVTETVQWLQQYRLQVVSTMGNPKGAGWYAAGAAASFSVDSVVAINATSRYRFIKWDGTGTGSYTGKDILKSVVIQGPVKEEAVWKTQYWIAMSIDPDGSGSVTPVNKPGGWGTALDTLRLNAVGSVQNGYGFFEWGGDTTGSSNPLMLVVKKTRNIVARFKKGSVLLTTDPTGLKLIVDGIEVVSPAGYTWLSGEKHQIGTIASQGDNVTAKYTFNNWNDSGAMEHQITVPANPVTLTAKFNALYYVNVQTDYGTPSGGGWFAGGGQTTVRVDTAVEQTGGIRQKFNGWTGTGSGSYTGSTNPVNLKVDGPIEQKAGWKQQYKLTMTTSPYPAPGARVDVTPAGPWYDLSKSVQAKYTILDPTYSFTGWSGDAGGTANPLTIVMNGAKNITAKFKTPNVPPTVASLPDTTLWEDGEIRFSFTWLGKFISDGNDALPTLKYELLNAPHFTLALDISSQSITFKPSNDWSGTENIIVRVTDPVGMSDEDTITVKVLPVADSPSTFPLVSPADNIVVVNFENLLRFVWRKSTDPDPGDAVRYSFFIGPGSTPGSGSTMVTDLMDTTIYMMTQASGVFYWGVTALDNQGNKTPCNKPFKIDIRTTGVDEQAAEKPETFALLQNYPNPFNPGTTIRYQMPSPENVRLSVFDLQGKQIRILVEAKMPAGHHEAQWDGHDASGQAVPSGVYLIKIEAGSFVQQRRMTLLK